MKEISKYLQNFITKEFHRETYTLSPEVYSFLSDKLNEISEFDSFISNKPLSIEYIDFSLNDEWKSGEHYEYLQPEVKIHLSMQSKIGVKCTFPPLGTQEITVFIIYPISNESQTREISKAKQHKYFQNILRKIYIWLCIANKYRDKHCSKQLSIYLYLTNLPKLLDDSPIIGRMHVNTGFTIACSPKNEIYIFREEEWFKVFIHETFHAFGIDFAHSKLNAVQELCKRRIYSIFDLPHIDILVFESFAEIWAEIINLLFVMYKTAMNKQTMQKMMSNEIQFSAFQCAKILYHSSMKYTDLYSKSPDAIQKRQEYRENSNVLSYYVLKSILYSHLNEFIIWNIHSNGASLKFNPISRNIHSFCRLITDNYNNPTYVDKLNEYFVWFQKHSRENNIQTKTLRMTIYET